MKTPAPINISQEPDEMRRSIDHENKYLAFLELKEGEEFTLLHRSGVYGCMRAKILKITTSRTMWMPRGMRSNHIDLEVTYGKWKGQKMYGRPVSWFVRDMYGDLYALMI